MKKHFVIKDKDGEVITTVEESVEDGKYAETSVEVKVPGSTKEETSETAHLEHIKKNKRVVDKK